MTPLIEQLPADGTARAVRNRAPVCRGQLDDRPAPAGSIEEMIATAKVVGYRPGVPRGQLQIMVAKESVFAATFAADRQQTKRA